MKHARVLIILVFLMCSSGFAHSSVVNVRAYVQAGQLIAELSDPAGFPIKNAKLGYVLFNQAGTTYRDALLETSDGKYDASVPHAAPGAYTLIFEDSTFPKESLQVKAEVVLPLVKSLSWCFLPVPPAVQAQPY